MFHGGARNRESWCGEIAICVCNIAAILPWILMPGNPAGKFATQRDLEHRRAPCHQYWADSRELTTSQPTEPFLMNEHFSRV